MSDELFELFLREDCDKHAQSVLLSMIDANSDAKGTEKFTFNRFNVLLDFEHKEAVIDDELNPSDGECRIPLEIFKSRIEEAI
jgi:hypothetical protein